MSMDSTNNDNDLETRRDGFIFKRQGAKKRRRKERWGVAPLPSKARAPEARLQQSPEGGGIDTMLLIYEGTKRRTENGNGFNRVGLNRPTPRQE